MAGAISWLRRHGPGLLGELLVNIVMPVLIYDRVVPAHGEMMALLASMAPPILWSLIAFLWTRHVDAIALVILAGIALSVLATLGGGSPRFLQLRENMVTGLTAIAFLISAAIGHPLIYTFAKAGAARQSNEQAAAFIARRDEPGFRRAMILMTLVWGIGLLASTILSCILVFTLTIPDYLIVGPILGYGFMGGLALWNL